MRKLGCIIPVLACLCAQAQTTPRQFRETALSPDGRSLAWTQIVPEDLNGKGPLHESEIWLLDLSTPGSAAHRIRTSKGVHAEHSPAFSPDNRQIAFLSDAEKSGQLELFVARLDGGGARRLTSLKGFLAAPRWSPDGRRIALLFTENAPRAAGPLEPSTRDSGPIEEHIYEQRLALVDVGSGEVRQVTPADTYVYEYDWSPDGARLAYTAARGNGDNNWWIAQLFTIAAGGANEVRQVYKPALQIANPHWSPDGRQIAFIGGIMSDEGSTGGDIYVVPADGGDARNLTPGRRGSPSSIRWLRSRRILFTETVDGGTALAALDPTDKITETLWRGDENLKSGDDVISVSDDGGTIGSVRSSWTLAPEVWAGPRGEWTQRTHLNQALKPAWGRSEKLHWKSDDAEVQGWLVYPADFDPKKKYPMVVVVHGGPASAKKPAWPEGHFDLTVLAARGYFVLFPNPRGSYGAGEAFTAANVRDFGHGDLRDILAGVDKSIETLPIDPGRIGIAGWSYGGYMTMWAVTQTTRFHAAVAGAGIANWQSYYGENLIDQWMIPYFGASVYDDPAVYERSSPIAHVKNVKTPTLMLVGDGDAECPAPQSYEFWHALTTLGVKTQLVVYPGEGHRVRRPEHMKDILERTVNWFNENME
jgi:dipeptidyl aminopeptidase/acylaminoacyl peptidase